VDPKTHVHVIDPAYQLLFFIVASVLIIVAGLPMAVNRVKPNHIYGFRVGRSMSDERVWYLTNSYAGRGMIIAGIVSLIAALALGPALSPVAYQLTCTFAIIGSLVVTLIATLIYMSRIP
jgi:uncharacterized membrane protein